MTQGFWGSLAGQSLCGVPEAHSIHFPGWVGDKEGLSSPGGSISSPGSSKLASVSTRCSAEPQHHPHNVIPVGFCENKGQGNQDHGDKDLQFWVGGYVPRWEPHPTWAHSLPLVHMSYRETPPVGDKGHGSVSVLVNSPDHRDVLKRSSDPTQPEEEACWVLELRNAWNFLDKTQTLPPSLPPSCRKCSQLNPGGSHAQRHTRPTRRPPCARPLAPLQQLLTFWSPLPLSDPPLVFTPLVGTWGQVSKVHPIHHGLAAPPP